MFLKIRYFERGLSKSLFKYVNFIFSFKQNGLELMISRSVGYKTSSEKFLC